MKAVQSEAAGAEQSAREDAPQPEPEVEALKVRSAFLALWERAGKAAAQEGFDIHAAANDPAFVALINAGMPFERAKEYVNLNERLREAQQQGRAQQSELMRARRQLPRPMRESQAYPNLALSDELVASIDAKLKRGERVIL